MLFLFSVQLFMPFIPLLVADAAMAVTALLTSARTTQKGAPHPSPHDDHRNGEDRPYNPLLPIHSRSDKEVS